MSIYIYISIGGRNCDKLSRFLYRIICYAIKNYPLYPFIGIADTFRYKQAIFFFISVLIVQALKNSYFINTVFFIS